MSIQSEITRISGNVSDSLAAVALKGVTVPSGSNSDDLAGLIGQISSGGGVTVTETQDANGGWVVSISGEESSQSRNLAYGVTYSENGKYINDAGAVKSSAAYHYCVDYIPVTPNTTYFISVTKSLSHTAGLTLPYYKSDQSFISRDVIVSASTATGIQSGTFITPSNCYYIRFSCSYGATDVMIYRLDVSKVLLNSVPLMDTTDKTVTANSMLSGITALLNNGKTATGTIASKSSSDLTASTLTVTAPAGYYASDATKTLSDEYLVAGNIKKDISIFGVTGTYEGAGSSGLTYETGTYTPTTDVARPTISFANTHSTRPFCVIIVDSSQSSSSLAATDSAMYWTISSWYDANGTTVYAASSTTHYARVQYGYKSSSNISVSGSNITSLTGTANSSMQTYLTASAFIPYVGSTSRYFRSGKNYKWIAVWKPTT